jgi:hypothetical protein
MQGAAERLVFLTRNCALETTGSSTSANKEGTASAPNVSDTVIDQLSFELGSLSDRTCPKFTPIVDNSTYSEIHIAIADLEEDLRSALIQLTALAPPVMQRLPEGTPRDITSTLLYYVNYTHLE